jgi:hypothetical protein
MTAAKLERCRVGQESRPISPPRFQHFGLIGALPYLARCSSDVVWLPRGSIGLRQFLLGSQPKASEEATAGPAVPNTKTRVVPAKEG